MPWWDNTDAFNEASGFPREFGAYGRDQMAWWLDQARRYGYNADWMQEQLQNYYWQMMNGDYTPPEDIAATSQRATPWINDAIDARNARYGQINDLWRGRQSVDDAFNPIYGRFNDQAGDITRTGELSQGEIDALARSLSARDEGVSGDIMGGIRNAFGRIDSGINDTFSGLHRSSDQTARDLLAGTAQAYGGLQDDSGRTFDSLRGSLDQTFGGLQDRTGSTFGTLRGDLGGTQQDITREIERLRPNTDFSMARAARAWAPTVAATNQRLRTMGIGPNDLQSLAALSDVESRRAAAMDDAAIEQNTGIADRLNQMRRWGYDQRAGLGLGELDRLTELGLGQQSGRERLGIQGLLNRQGLTEREQGIGRDLTTDALNRGINLGIGQHDRSTASALGALDAANNERVRSMMNLQQIAGNRTDQSLANLLNQYRMTSDWRSGLNNTDLAAYDARLRDIGMSQDLLRDMNANDLQNVALRNQQYGIGNEWWQNQHGRRDAGAANIGNLMTGQYGQRQQANNNAMGWGNTAMDAYGTARGYDANRGNLGFRLIGGMAAPLLGMIPGVGPALQGGLGAFMGQYGQQGTQLQPYTGQPQQSRSTQSSGAGYMTPRYSNTAAAYMPQVQQWNNLPQSFARLRM